MSCNMKCKYLYLSMNGTCLDILGETLKLIWSTLVDISLEMLHSIKCNPSLHNVSPKAAHIYFLLSFMEVTQVLLPHPVNCAYKRYIPRRENSSMAFTLDSCTCLTWMLWQYCCEELHLMLKFRHKTCLAFWGDILTCPASSAQSWE